MASNQGEASEGSTSSNMQATSDRIPEQSLNLEQQPDHTQVDEGPTSAQDNQRRGRGPAKMPKGRYLIAEVTVVGEPALPKTAIGPYKTACGVVARDHVPIIYRAWSGRHGDPTVVPDELKETLWNKIKKVFQFPSGTEELARKRALQVMSTSWKNRKTTLNNSFVKKDRTPDFDTYPRLRKYWDEFVEYKKSEEQQIISEKNKANSSKNVYPHTLGRGGYVNKIPEWNRREEELTLKGVQLATSELATRSKHWMLARGATFSNDGTLRFRSERVQELSQKITDAHVQSSKGSFHPRKENDELTLALGNKEHPGRTQGVGLVPWKAAFRNDSDTYRRPRRSNQEEFDARVEEKIALLTATLEQKIDESIAKALGKRPLQESDHHHISTPKSSQASAVNSLPEMDSTRYPVDSITEPTICSLHVYVAGITIEVAEGQAWPCKEGQILHSRMIPPGYAKVSVDWVNPTFHQINLEIPGEQGRNKLGENLGSFVAWRKRYIMFGSADQDDNDADSPSMEHPTRRSPPTPSPPPRKSPSPTTQTTKCKEPPRPPTRFALAPSPKKHNYGGTSGKYTKSVSKLPYKIVEEETGKAAKESITNRSKMTLPPEKVVIKHEKGDWFLKPTKVKQTGRKTEPSQPSKLSDYERIVTKKYKVTAKASNVASLKEVDLTKPRSPLRWSFEIGKPLVDPAREAKLTTHLRRLHDWYIHQHELTKQEAFAVKYKDMDFHNGDGIFWVELKELHQLYQQDALDVSILRLWTLMELHLLRARGNVKIGFLDPGLVNEKLVQDESYRTPIEEYVLNVMHKQQNKNFIILPYNFKFHWILLAIKLEKSKIYIFDSMRKPTDDFKGLLELLDRVYERYLKKSVMPASFTKKFQIVQDFPCLRQEHGNNLCGFYAMRHMHLFITNNLNYITKMHKKPGKGILPQGEIEAIQEQVAEFILREILHGKGEFHGSS